MRSVRPPGDVRKAVYGALVRLTAAQGPVTRRDVAHAALVNEEHTHATLRNLAAAGEVARVGKHKLPGSSHWMTLYEPVSDGDDGGFPLPQAWCGIEALCEAVHQMAGASKPPADNGCCESTVTTRAST